MCASLTSYAVVEKPPEQDKEYGEAQVILEDHLRPDRPVKKPGVGWVSEPPAAEGQAHTGELQRGAHAYTPSFTSRCPTTLWCATM